MSKLNITGGIISLEDGIKAKEEFAPARKARVELHFDIPEGSDHDVHVQGVSDLARAHLHRILHNTAAPVVAHIAAAQPAALVEVPKETAAAKKARLAAEKAAGAPADKTKADLEREQLEELQAAGKGTAADELDEKPAAKTHAVEKDELADLLGDTAPTPVTDQELGKAAQEKNGKMKSVVGWSPERIRELVGKFVLVDGKPKAGAKLQEIPAAQRHDFLAQLDALK